MVLLIIEGYKESQIKNVFALQAFTELAVVLYCCRIAHSRGYLQSH